MKNSKANRRVPAMIATLVVLLILVAVLLLGHKGEEATPAPQPPASTSTLAGGAGAGAPSAGGEGELANSAGRLTLPHYVAPLPHARKVAFRGTQPVPPGVRNPFAGATG